jgi:hypothetical protein
VLSVLCGEELLGGGFGGLARIMRQWPGAVQEPLTAEGAEFAEFDYVMFL